MKKRTFSIIIPTYREAKNIPHLLQALHHALDKEDEFEVILADDNSQDGTIELVRSLQTKYPWVRLLLREGARSLSQSVIDGFYAAKYPLLVCMDADLSHPVAAIPKMLDVLQEDSVGMVVGSRYIANGSVDSVWPWRRKLLSRLCGIVTRLALKLKVHDPLSGFFIIKKSIFMQGNLTQATGWKIGLEMMVKCPCAQIIEYPIHFTERRYGTSKLNLKIGASFAGQLRRLVYYRLTR